MLKSVFTVVLPSSQGARGDRHVLRPGDGAGEVVGQVHRGLDRLRELDHHHITQCVAVLVVKSVKISAKHTKKIHKRVCVMGDGAKRKKPGSKVEKR